MSIPACEEDKATFEVQSPEPKQGFYMTYGKRALDLFASAFGLLTLSPFFLMIAIGIKLTSRGRVLFRQTRIGRQGRPFSILKFRSMYAGDDGGSAITVAGDRRVTSLGKFLRRFKLDELPQLWNVFCGDMSLVGPRPEVPAYVAHYTSEQRVVLSVRPGITDPSSLAYRDEEAVLEAASDPEHFYRTCILPDKLARSSAYLQKITFLSDLRIILQTLGSSLF
jgi:lipopolysaccharide/colanic/teichoic acid biosynthesis glycosyltransferase